MLSPLAREPLRRHRALARHHYWQLQLFRCSLIALFASVAAWLAGLPLGWHLGAVALGFAAGFLWQVRGSTGWALDWIEEQSGLSYRTALELRADGDRYGLAEGVHDRVADQLRRLEPPAQQAWWLPVLTLALGLTLLPVLQLSLSSGPGPAPGVSGRELPAGPAPEAPEATEVTLGEGDGEASRDGEPEQPQADEGRDLGEVDQRFGGEGRPGAQDGAGAPPDESETLSRFLQDLESRPPEPEAEEPEADGARPGAQNSQGQGQQPQGAQAGEENEGQSAEGSAASREGEGEVPGEQGPGQNENGEGSQGGPPQEPAAGEGPPAPGQEEAPQSGAGEGEAEGEGGGAPAEGQGEGPSPEEGGPNGAGDGAGVQGAAATPGDPSQRGLQPQGDPEGLEGRFLGGETNIGGEVLLPGAEGAPLPEGGPAGGFERALEQAITEGRIPVEYQEILRDYYR